MTAAETSRFSFLCDEDFDNNIMHGFLRHFPALDLIRVQDAIGLPGKRDAAVLEWAAQQGRVVLTHDVNTMTTAAYQRTASGKLFPSLLVIPRLLAIGTAIEDLVLVVECGTAEDCEN